MNDLLFVTGVPLGVATLSATLLGVLTGNWLGAVIGCYGALAIGVGGAYLTRGIA